MNLIISPRHKEEADRLMLVLSISCATLLEQSIYNKNEVVEYISQYFPASKLMELDSNVQCIFSSFTDNRQPYASFENVYSDSLQVLKNLPFWSNIHETWVDYDPKNQEEGSLMSFHFQGTVESIRIIYMICLGLAYALKNDAISVDDAEILLFKPYLMDLFEGVDSDVVEIIDRGTYLENAVFFKLDINQEFQYILDRSLDKIKTMKN